MNVDLSNRETEPTTPEIDLLVRLAETCALMRRGAGLELAEAAIGEERRLRQRIERLRAKLAVVSVVETEGRAS